jgi:hypothetical protein
MANGSVLRVHRRRKQPGGPTSLEIRGDTAVIATELPWIILILVKICRNFRLDPTAAMGTAEDIVVGIVYDASDVVGAYLRG